MKRPAPLGGLRVPKKGDIKASISRLDRVLQTVEKQISEFDASKIELEIEKRKEKLVLLREEIKKHLAYLSKKAQKEKAVARTSPGALPDRP